MWFKGVTLFRLQDRLALETLETALEPWAFRPPLSQEPMTLGWVSPWPGQKNAPLSHSVQGCYLLCVRQEDKLLPASVVRELLAERVALIEERDARRLRRKEKDQLRDELLMELYPKAFHRSRQTYAYLDNQQRYLVIDSVNAKTVESVTGLLRKTLGSLPIAPLRTQHLPAHVFSHWLQHAPAAGITLGDECELRDAGEQGAIIRCKSSDLHSDEILQHLQAGKQVTRLALHWDERLSLVLDQDLTLRRLRPLERVVEQLDDYTGQEPAEQAARFDAEFALLCAELREFSAALLQWLGGEAA